MLLYRLCSVLLVTARTPARATSVAPSTTLAPTRTAVVATVEVTVMAASATVATTHPPDKQANDTAQTAIAAFTISRSIHKPRKISAHGNWSGILMLRLAGIGGA
jgi:hypothetical protein